MIDERLMMGFVVVALFATSYVLVTAFRTGKVSDLFNIHRSKSPTAFWIYCAFAGWVVIACLQYLFSALITKT